MFEEIFGEKKNVTNEGAAFHITITHKKTGKVEYDSDTNVILGAFNEGDRTNGIVMAAADVITCAFVLGSARKAIKNFAEDNPALDIILHIISENDRKEPENESEDTAE